MSQPADESSEPKTELSFTIEILKIIKESQQQHGLRHLDYQRYRSYCTSRLRRVRKTLHFVCGNMKKFQKREINPDEITDSKFLLLPLISAERAWAYAMQLKQESNTEPRKKFHMMNKLKKATKYSNELEKLSQSNKFDARTKLEAQGYNSLILGQFFFEMQKWKESLNHFNIAKKIYEKLSATLAADDSQAYYLQKVEEILPNIRYCNYNLGDESAKKDLLAMKMKTETGSELAEKIDELISQTKEKHIVTFSELTWRNKTLQVKHEKVKSFLANVQEFEKQIQTSNSFDFKISTYESILKESIDAIQILRDELKLDPLFQTIQRGQVLQAEDKPSNSLLLFAYLTSLRINKTIERNLLMIETFRNASKQTGTASQGTVSSDEAKMKNAKPQDIVRLYDIILQNYKDLGNLPGLSNDKQFLSDTEFLILFYKTFRVFYISLFYLANKKYKEAAGFCFKVEKNARLIESSLEKFSKTSDLLNSKADFQAQLKNLLNELNESEYKLQTAAILEDGTAESAESKKENDKTSSDKMEKNPLVERMDVYYEDRTLVENKPNVVRFPLNYEPIPCKPLFFDLALNHLELPSLEDKIDAKKPSQQQQQGVKGFIKGFFGFS